VGESERGIIRRREGRIKPIAEANLGPPILRKRGILVSSSSGHGEGGGEKGGTSSDQEKRFRGMGKEVGKKIRSY